MPLQYMPGAGQSVQVFQFLLPVAIAALSLRGEFRWPWRSAQRLSAG